MRLTAREIAERVNISKQAICKKAQKERWAYKTEKGRGGPQRLYEVDALPEDIKNKVVQTHNSSPPSSGGVPTTASLEPTTTPDAGGLIPPPAEDFQLAPSWAQGKARMWGRIIEESKIHSSEFKNRTDAIEHFIAKYNTGFVDQELLKESGKISRSTFYIKMALYNKEGLNGLLPLYKGRENSIHPDIQKKAIAYLLERSRKIKRIYEYLKSEFPPEIFPSYSTLRRFLNAWAEEHPQEVCMAHWGEHRWKKKFLAAFGDASAEAPYPNAVWEIDSTVADIITTDGKRHKIVAAIDVFSRLCPTLTLQPKNNAWGVVQTLARGIENYGIPEKLKKDNGKDYASRWVNGFCRDLHIQTPKLPVKTPEKRPHIERFFGTLSRGLFSELTGHTGNCLLTRPEEICVAYDSDELKGILKKWAEHEYNEAVCSTTKQVRRERFFQSGFRMRKISKEEMDILINPTYPKKVGKNGISFDGRNYFSPEFVGLIGKHVIFRLDVNDISHGWIFFRKKLFCEVHDPGAAQWSLDEYLEQKRSHKKALKQSIKIEKELARGDVKDRMLDHLNKKEKETPLRFPQPTEIKRIIEKEIAPHCTLKETELEKPKTPYDEFPTKITELPTINAWENWEYLMKAEVLGIEIAPKLLKWKEDYENGRIPGLENNWWNLYGKYKDDPTTVFPIYWELERLRKYTVQNGR